MIQISYFYMVGDHLLVEWGSLYVVAFHIWVAGGGDPRQWIRPFVKFLYLLQEHVHCTLYSVIHLYVCIN
jgi:hypothetical protein